MEENSKQDAFLQVVTINFPTFACNLSLGPNLGHALVIGQECVDR